MKSSCKSTSISRSE